MSTRGEKKRELYYRCKELGILDPDHPRPTITQLVAYIDEYMDLMSKQPHFDWYKRYRQMYSDAWDIWWWETCCSKSGHTFLDHPCRCGVHIDGICPCRRNCCPKCGTDCEGGSHYYSYVSSMWGLTPY